MKSKLFVLSIAAGLVAAVAARAQVQNSKITGQSFTCTTTIKAAPAVVWAQLTDAQNLSKVLDYEYTGPAFKFSRLGDNVRMTSMGDTGTLILTYIKPGSELRYTWEPDNGSYICQQRWTVAPDGKMVKATLIERYTESGGQTPADIAAQSKAFDEGMMRLKKTCEKT